MVMLIPSILWWGRRLGFLDQHRGLIIKGSRGGMGRGTFHHKQPKENQGGVGRKARRRVRYANPKLREW